MGFYFAMQSNNTAYLSRLYNKRVVQAVLFDCMAKSVSTLIPISISNIYCGLWEYTHTRKQLLFLCLCEMIQSISYTFCLEGCHGATNLPNRLVACFENSV